MPAYRKASIRELVKAAYQLDGHVLQGILHHTEDGWMIDDVPLDDFLEGNQDEDVALLLLSLGKDADRPMKVRVCQTCGREYSDVSCPHCREVRLRLRGR